MRSKTDLKDDNSASQICINKVTVTPYGRKGVTVTLSLEPCIHNYYIFGTE